AVGLAERRLGGDQSRRVLEPRKLRGVLRRRRREDDRERAVLHVEGVQLQGRAAAGAEVWIDVHLHLAVGADRAQVPLVGALAVLVGGAPDALAVAERPEAVELVLEGEFELAPVRRLRQRTGGRLGRRRRR